MSDPDGPRRCIRQWWGCADPETVIEDNRKTHLPALVEPGQRLCPACIRHLGYTLVALPLDVAELTDRMVPSMAVRYRDPSIPGAPRIKLHSPVPIDLAAEGLRALVDHEVAQIAAHTAEEAGVAWSAAAAVASGMRQRVHDGCQLLAYRRDHLLGLPSRWHRVWSRGEHPLDGWDEEQRARMTHTRPGEWWIERDGTACALTLFALHEAVERYTGQASAERCRVPCPKCRRSALWRDHRFKRITCHGCWHEMGDNDYDQLVDVAATVFGVAR